MFPTLEIPTYGLANDRETLPQIKSAEAFLRFLRKNDVSYKQTTIHAHELKPAQVNFDKEKIASLMGGGSHSPIIVSQDNHVLDGHHRWLADYNNGKVCHVIQVEKNILDLIALGRRHEAEGKSKATTIRESISHEKLRPHLEDFAKFAATHLELESVPHIKLEKLQGTFGGYNPGSKDITLSTANRHPMDIFRTLAHEMQHYKQDHEGRISDPDKDGTTGSDIENEANAKAGVLMRLYAKTNRDKFDLEYVNEGVDPNDPANREFATKSLDDIYRAGTPGEGKKPKKKPSLKRIDTGNDGVGPTAQMYGSPLMVNWGNGYIREEQIRRYLQAKTGKPK